MSERKIKWGIMGPGNISRKFASDLVQSENAELVAVASRTEGKAAAFASEFNIPRSYSNYDEFVQDPELEIVYIGTLHPQHKECVLQCLNAGKAVICEKPFTMNAEEAEELIKAARENNTFLMEAMWTRYLPAVVKAMNWIKEGKIGEVNMLTANFGFNAGWNPGSRLLDKKLGGGAMLDAGIYPISFASLIFGTQPTNIKSSAHIGETGVDEWFSALFEYGNGKTAMLNAGIRLNLANDAYIYGTEGYIHLPNFLFGAGAYLHRPGSEVEGFKDERNQHGYIYEAEEAMKCLREGKIESSIMPLDETYDIMKTMDTLRKQWGLDY
ncbi:Gfo/Idh/MocA family protein [Lederbergia wuyishanensis]|uniref:Dehydrogenase n=1 Tax=Lederbergia wuyishanensis TaxID=1347903 RepID=A0ABU0D6J2_9BACI|nr:Gfo/Idh/MocA family oxidoreductase [Lederbergia wuyishanensis]MCJ8008606.1 Gfo/Idh/MocA family oxidoreductase [Lederbergia wuyishanensis]MDQ0343978.1 putative dehydrogenase [Lederbergia wuyishanensis]